MLTHLSIRNYLLAEHLDLDFFLGMTVLTGETGAGKSIILDALSLALGGRVDRDYLNHNGEKVDISATFQITQTPKIIEWLKEHDLDYNQEECILRRVITQEGRSRGYINGVSCPINELKTISQQLIDLHNQHGHQLLFYKPTHRQILDSFGHCHAIAKKTAELSQKYKITIDKKKSLLAKHNLLDDKQALLHYQLTELEELNLLPEELEQLEQKHQQSLHAQNNLKICHDVINLCANDESEALIQKLNLCQKKISELSGMFPNIQIIMEMFSSAHIQLDEAVTELKYCINQCTSDPEQLSMIEKRLDIIYTLARKHRINPEQLPEKLLSIQQELKALEQDDQHIQLLNQQQQNLLQQFREVAQQLSSARQKAAKQLSDAVTKQLKLLDMPHSQFLVSLTPNENNEPTSLGLESVEFLITTNPNHPPKPLSKVASGGELSRISLAIQVITTQFGHTNTIIFDEIDVGISGKTAETVGNMLQYLGHTTQILCITHQPQVAAKGNNHIYVKKTVANHHTKTTLTYLNADERTREIARMLAGTKITKPSLAHAEDMLSSDQPLSTS